MTRSDKKETYIAQVTKVDLDKAVEQAHRLRQYHHKNIMRYVDDYIDDTWLGRVHICLLGNCSGGDLRSFIKQHAGKPEFFGNVYWKYFRGLIDGLVEVHSRNELHGKVQPENIFLDGPDESSRVLKLGLFGQENQSQQDEALNAYLSPETISSGIHLASSDVWAAGVILHELFTGPVPHSNSTDSL